MTSRLALLFAALVLSSCGENVTQVVVSVDAESAWLADTTALRVIVRGARVDDGVFASPSSDLTLQVGEGQAYAFPVDVIVAPLGGDTTRRWSVEATAVNTVTNATATVRVRGLYVANRTLRVSLLLENTCAGVVCENDQTCRAGVCEDATFMSTNDAGAEMDGGLSLYCPSPDVRTPNASDGTLDTAGIPPVYPTLAVCPSDHDVNEMCGAGGICFGAGYQAGGSYCRTPCSMVDDPVCNTVHPDSRCVPVVGVFPDGDRMLCSTPCNPFDDVGCPAGLHCMAVSDSTVSSFHTDCREVQQNPRHYLEPCSLSEGQAYPSSTGCAPGYTCGYDAICGGSEDGSVCLQICDPDEDRVECPAGSRCYRLADETYDDAIGPIHIGRCGPM